MKAFLLGCGALCTPERDYTSLLVRAGERTILFEKNETVIRHSHFKVLSTLVDDGVPTLAYKVVEGPDVDKELSRALTGTSSEVIVGHDFLTVEI